MAAETTKSPLQTVGNYDLLEKVAEGGMGTVYKGKNRDTGQIVAVKLVSPQMASNEVFRQRFEKEYQVARDFDHPNVIRALDYGTSGGRPFLVMEFIEGESLGQRIERVGRISEAESIKIMGQAAQGLQQAHKRGLIHRDIKPDNLMITPGGQVKIADMGLVKELEADINLTRTGRGLGTPHFMAPEQFRNAKNADVRCDVYSLAATLYMMVTGQMPFHALGPLDAWMKKINNELTPPRKLNKQLSERTDAAIRRAMSADPDLRPASCSEFMEELTGKNTRKLPVQKLEGTQELWYLIYKDEEGAPHMVKGTVMGIRRSLKEGLLGDASNVRAGRTKTGTFEPLHSIAQFRDLVAAAPESAPANPEGTQLMTAASNAPPKPKQEKPIARPRAKRSGMQIPLETRPSSSMEWAKLLLLLAIAMGVGVAVTILLQR